MNRTVQLTFGQQVWLNQYCWTATHNGHALNKPRLLIMKAHLHSRVFWLTTILIISQCLHVARAFDVFPIATTTTIESGFQSAFDGSNYLVGVRGGPLAEGTITAVLISRTGQPLASTNLIGVSGGMPQLAFDGTNYFMVWNGSSGSPGFNGQFVSKTCDLVRNVLTITNLTPRASSLAYGAGKYLACWSDETKIYGRFITPDGELHDVTHVISREVYRPRENAIGFDGTNFFVVFNGGGNLQPNIYGQFVSPTGELTNGTVLINSSTNPCDNPLAVAFDGTNYLVTFNEEAGGLGGSFHVFGRLVSTSGTVLSDKITIAAGPGIQLFPSSAFDGSSHLVSWAQATSPTNVTLTLRFFNRAVQPLGPEFAPFPVEGTNRPVLGAPLFDGERFLVTAVLASLTAGFSAASGDAYGAFVPSSMFPPRLDPAGPLAGGQFPLKLTGTPGIQYAIEMKTYLGLTGWTAMVTNSPSNGTYSFIDTHATNASRFYRAVKQ